MSATVHHHAMGHKTVVTRDKYGVEHTYEFHPSKEGISVEPRDGYTPVVLKALWDEGVPVQWDPDDLSASERKQLDGFCDDCGTAINHRQVGPDEWEDYCESCDEVKSLVRP